MFEELLIYIKDQFSNNDFLTGIIGGGIITSLLYVARNIPNKLWLLYTRNCAWEFRINDINPFYQPCILYFSNKLKNKIRRIKIEQTDDQIDYTPDYGNHYLIDGFNIIIVSISEETMEHSKERKENIKVQIYGISPKRVFENIIKQVYTFRDNIIDKKYIYDYGFYWSKIKSIPLRHIDNIFIDDNITKDIISEIDTFLTNEEEYNTRGISYTKGLIFYGEAGTGKSSMAIALANYYSKNLCYLDLNGISDIPSAKDSFSNIPKNSILILEDIDTVKSVHTRDDNSKDPDTSEKIPLSTILQLLDGMYVPDGTIIIATTNYFEKLDKAFTRYGRFDLKINFPKANKLIAEKMVNKLNPDKKYILEEIKYPISQAELQSKLF